MQYFRPGSQLRQLITMLSIVGEYPIRSLYLLGNERAYKAMVHKLTTPETFRIPQSETELTTRLLTVTGKGNGRSVRFYKGALPILDWLHPDAYRYYMDAFWEHKFPGNAAHRDRNHRVAEAVASTSWSGVEFQLKTDAGVYPGTVKVGTDGVLRLEIGGSSQYILTCMNSSTSLPEPEDTADSTDRTQAPATTEQSPESNEKAESGIPTLHIILFAGGMVIAIGTLIVMQILKKKRENEAPDDEEDEE